MLNPSQGWDIPINVDKPYKQKLIPLVNAHFQELLEKTELQRNHKLTNFHLDVNRMGNEKQRVRLAAQVLSNSVAKAFTWGKKSPESHPEDFARHDAIQLFDQWFDISNSYQKFNKNPFNCGLHEENKDELFRVLDRMMRFLDCFRVRANSHQPWITGIRAWCQSLKLLYKDLVVDGDFDFILTRRLNQDCLGEF